MDFHRVLSNGGVVLTHNLPIEIYASKIYTRTMFEKFSEMLYEGGLYMLVEVVQRREYTTGYVKKNLREMRCKNYFVVQVNGPGDEFKCECGMFEHFKMVCSHALKGSGSQEHHLSATRRSSKGIEEVASMLKMQLVRSQKEHLHQPTKIRLSRLISV